MQGTQASKTISFTGSRTGFMIKADADQIDDLAKLKVIMATLGLNHGTQTVTEIAAKINTAITLDMVIATGVINIDAGNPFTILSTSSTITLHANANTNGEITISATMTTTGATTPLAPTIDTPTIQRKSNAEMQADANRDALLSSANTLSAPTLKSTITSLTASAIAAKITSFADIKDLLGLDVTGVYTDPTAVVTFGSATGLPDGTLTINFKVVTTVAGQSVTKLVP